VISMGGGIFACGVLLLHSPSLVWFAKNQLILARAVQAGGALTPGSLAIISASFSSETAIGTWSGFTGITSALGPVLGGWLVEQASWRWIFLLMSRWRCLCWALCFGACRRAVTKKALIDWTGGCTASNYRLGDHVYGLIESSNLGLAIQWCSAPGSWRSHADRIYLCRGSQSGTNDALTLFRSQTFRGKLADVPIVRRLRRSPILSLNLIQVQGYSATARWRCLPLIPDHVPALALVRRLVSRYGASHLMVGPTIAAIDSLCLQCHELAAVTG